MQITERLVTKAAASAARAQPAESRDRKYDKHLSYSATWGRSAGRAGSRGGGGTGGEGQKFDPEARRPRCLRGFRDGRPWRAGGQQRPQLGHSQTPPSPDAPVACRDVRTAGRGLQLEPGSENAPCARRPRPNTRNGSPSQQYFRSRTEPSYILRGLPRHGAEPAARRPRWQSPRR